MTTRRAAITTPTADAAIPNTSRLRRSPVPMLAIRAEGDASIGVWTLLLGVSTLLLTTLV